MRLLRIICVAALALSLATSVYAGTQSVKISGDITVRGLARHDYDLDLHHNENFIGTIPSQYGSAMGGSLARNYVPGTSDWDTYFMTTTEVQLDADLTDNVSAVIRLYNQRDWNSQKLDNNKADAITGMNRTQTLWAQGDDQFAIGVDLAYVELKEFLYSPLSLKIGRQDVWFGKGFIVGANRQTPLNNISAPEYTAVNSFDSFRATLDYDPWTIDAMYAKIQEGNVGSKDDIDLYGLNLGYIFDSYNAEAEAYWFFKDDNWTTDQAVGLNVPQANTHNTIHTLGLRGSADPIENWTVATEIAWQLGQYRGFTNQTEARARNAWALDVSVETRHFKDMFAWKPVLGGEYIYYSGDHNNNDQAGAGGTYTGWDPMYRGKYDSAIREWFGRYYWSTQGARSLVNNFGNANNPEDSATNQQQAIIMGSIQPTDSLKIDGRYLAFWQAQKRGWYVAATGGSLGPGTEMEPVKMGQFIGQEVDLELTWDYTEDVSFGLLAAWFFPGTGSGGVYANSESNNTATDVVGTMKLSF